MVGRGPGSRRWVKWGKPTPSSETNPLPGLVASSARSSYPERGWLLGRVLLRPPRSPRQAIRIPCKHKHRKRRHGPIQGDRKEKYSRRPNCRHTPRILHVSMRLPKSLRILQHLGTSRSLDIYLIGSCFGALEAPMYLLSIPPKINAITTLAAKISQFL